MVTIRFIAQEAGVSKSTVSRYLNNGYVSPSTAKKIERAIKEHNFTPNDFARNLKIKESSFIGVIIPRFDSAATTGILGGIDEFNFAKKYQKLIVNSKQNIENEVEAIYSLEKNKVAGIILVATGITKEHIEAIKSINIPVLIVGQYDDSLYCVTHNDYQSAYSLAEALITSSHYSEVVYIGVNEKDVSVGKERKFGIQDALKAHDFPNVVFYETTFNIKDAYQLAEKVFKEHTNCLFICATDNIAIGFMKIARELGVEIPQVVSIAGFGGYSIGEQVSPTLTTVDYHFTEVGEVAAEKLEALINGESIEKKTIIGTSILKRESTK